MKKKIELKKKKNCIRKGLFSIIVPCYNSSQFIDRCMNSILIQTYKKFEVLIVDDGSTDLSYKMLKKFSFKDKRFKIIRHKNNLGVSSARNSGLNLSVGQFVAFLDIDDWWPKNKLDIYASYFSKGYDLLFSNYYRVKSYKDRRLIRVRKNIHFDILVFSNLIPTSTGAYDQEKIGFKVFDFESPSEDWLFWLSLIKVSKKSQGIQKNLMFYNVSNQSLSANKLKMAKKAWFIFRKFHKYGVVRSTYCFLIYSYNGIRRFFI